MTRTWTLPVQEGFEKSLKYIESPKPLSAEDLDAHEVLVALHAASLNYRELNIASPGGGIHGPAKPNVVPGSDGAGLVKAVGSAVTEFKAGDRVVLHMAPKNDEDGDDDGLQDVQAALNSMGERIDGSLRSEGIFSDKALVLAPNTLSWLEAGTLTCTWVTAWNGLFGLKGLEVGPGSWILVQGTGGVSIATLQLAVAAGATVVATTSSKEKESRLKQLGAAHTINYRENPEDWGQKARDFTPSGRGFDMVMDVGGNETLPQSMASTKVDGIVNLVGSVGSSVDPVPVMSALLNTCIIRGFLLGSRNQFKELVRFIDEKSIKPAVDDVVFELAEVRDAYRRLSEQKHFSKVLIRIDQKGDVDQ